MAAFKFYANKWLLMILISLWVICGVMAQSQQILVNSKGESIVMFPDGSWRIASTADSMLLNQYVRKNQAIPDDLFSSAQPTERTEAEEHAFLMKQWKEIFTRISAEEKEVQNIFRAATNSQFKATSKLENAQSNKKLIEPDVLAGLQETYDESVENLKKVKLQQNEIKTLVEKARKTNSKPKTITDAKVMKFRTEFNNYLLDYKWAKDMFSAPVSQPAPAPAPVVTQETTQVATPQEKPKADALVSPPAATAIAYDGFDPVMIDKRPSFAMPVTYTPAEYLCQFDKDTLDQSTRTRTLELSTDVLFTHTDPDLRQYFRDTELITCRGRLSKTGPYLYLAVEFRIASSHATPNFGGLAEGSLLRCKLMNGEFVSFYNLKYNSGRIDPYTGHTIFVGQYAIGKKESQKLLKSELDELRVLWNTGFEDYDVYAVDFFIDQLRCIENYKDKNTAASK